MYTFETKVRYSELAGDGLLSVGALINYFQDCSTFQSESLGLGVEALKKRGRAWFLSAWQIEIDRYPSLLEKVVVGTAPWGFKSFYGYRNFALMTPEGKAFVRANSIWIFVDGNTGRPVKPDASDVEAYRLEKPISMEYRDRKIPVKGQGEEKEPFFVGRHQIDTNGHMNNSQYVQMAAEYLPENFRPAAIRAEYKKAARCGEKMIPILYKEEPETIVTLCTEERKPYAIVAFSENKETL